MIWSSSPDLWQHLCGSIFSSTSKQEIILGLKLACDLHRRHLRRVWAVVRCRGAVMLQMWFKLNANDCTSSIQTQGTVSGFPSPYLLFTLNSLMWPNCSWCSNRPLGKKIQPRYIISTWMSEVWNVVVILQSIITKQCTAFSTKYYSYITSHYFHILIIIIVIIVIIITRLHFHKKMQRVIAWLI